MARWCSLSCLLWSFFLLGSISAIFLGILAASDGVRQAGFAKVCSHMSARSGTEMATLRCEVLEEVAGDVVEIGPGPGTNFDCYENMTGISSWTGIEPNAYMHSYLQETKEKRKLGFPVTVLEATAERMDGVADASADIVVSTHVLCSVNDVQQALREISRILKPGGKFVFLEHVAAPQDSWVCSMQNLISPVWHIVGDGCAFRYVDQDIMNFIKTTGSLTDPQMTLFQAPMPKLLAIVKPHVRGHATKPRL